MIVTLIKLFLVNKINATENLSFLINSSFNLKQFINNPDFYLREFSTLFNKINNPITEFVSDNEIKIIDKFAEEFVTPEFNNRYFRSRNFSDKLEQTWNILNIMYNKSPFEIVYCVTQIIDKKIPKNLTNQEKKFTKELVSKFGRKAKNVNDVTDLIFNQVRHDYQNNDKDVLTICGILISFVLNAESHLYFVMENLREARTRLGITSFDLEDIFSIEGRVAQNTINVTDINAIRNAISHGAFDIKFDYGLGEYIIDFQSILSSYRFNRKYSGSEFLDLYRNYDKLRDIQELLIRMAFLKATLKLYFTRHTIV